MIIPLIRAKNIEFGFMPVKGNDKLLTGNPFKALSSLYNIGANRQYVKTLKGISFELMPGERLGILGANGAGKSTLIRVLAGIYPVNSGTLEVNGHRTGLFDIAVGMNQHATGLENIYLRGLQSGLTMGSIKKKIQEILDFTELGDYINEPLSNYSTGMKLRLAFSIATLVEAEILLMDEWLGAGDARFKEKVNARMDELVSSSKGLILTSHNTSLVKRLCQKGLVLDKGQQVFYGQIDNAIEFYDILSAKK